ncbi:hypothetical protein [Paraglaciecola hydrolytica]|uniref:Uncharacterized protein n=1 Tax=Paraglaciecola hydrolytica TaxID=1799789 RepID=A0A136A6L0_9ALTE|nr:hypothetical protein [Paraglaciecola hydrolytica]KXI30856.1 hypothetical protein AX660_05490 [Paraglaciecola hydrolytica]
MAKKIIIGILLIPLGVVLIPVLMWVFLITFFIRTYIRLRLRMAWPKARYILFTYTDSESWSPYIEQNILPKIESYAQIINRTNEQDWKTEHKLERKAVEVWSSINVNPLAIVFEPGKKVKVIPFYEAFRDLKHGKQEQINSKCQELFQCLPSYP